MKNISRFRVDIGIFLCIVLFALISIITIGSAQNLLSDDTNLMLKQILWYSIGFIIIYLVMIIGNNFLYKNAWILYIIGISSLILVLFF